jgi:Cytochrome c554 and c-prime
VKTRIGFAITVLVCGGVLQANEPSSSEPDYLGSDKCAACHADIAKVHAASDHAQTLRRVERIPELLKQVPLAFRDSKHEVEYRLERSSSQNLGFDLIASQAGQSERLRLIWGLGAGRKGITFIGRDEAGRYGESRVSWYQRIQLLDITTGAEFSKPKTAHAALAGWLDSSERQRCFGCHVTHQADAVPEEIQQANAGVQCERCHGPGRRHVEAATQGKTPLSETIVNPGKLKASDQLNYCGQCHRAPSENLGQVMTDKSTIRFPAQRLVLSRCYDESNGKLKCTTCHDPHGNLPQSMSAYDPKCLSCHAGRAAMGSPCPISKKDCVTCHMPVEPLMKHSEFADHWIRKIRGPLGRN